MSEDLRRSHRILAKVLNWLLFMGLFLLIIQIVPAPIFFGFIVLFAYGVVVLILVLFVYFKVLKWVLGATPGPLIVKYLVLLWARLRRG